MRCSDASPVQTLRRAERLNQRRTIHDTQYTVAISTIHYIPPQPTPKTPHCMCLLKMF